MLRGLFSDMEGEEAFHSSAAEYVDEVIEERIADNEVIRVKCTKNTSAVMICFITVIFLPSLIEMIVETAAIFLKLFFWSRFL